MSDTPRERIRKMMQDADDNNVPAHHRPGLVMSLLRQFGDELAAMTARAELAERQVAVLCQLLGNNLTCSKCPAYGDKCANCVERLAAWSRAEAANAGAVPRRGSDVGTSPLLGLPGSGD